MTRKDFVLIAKEINALREQAGSNQEQINLVKLLANNFVQVLRGTNANFNQSRFLQACGF